MTEKTSEPLALFDEKRDVVYLRVRPGRPVSTRSLEWGGVADLDVDGEVVSVRVCFASSEIPWGILDLLPRVEWGTSPSAVCRVIPVTGSGA